MNCKSCKYADKEDIEKFEERLKEWEDAESYLAWEEPPIIKCYRYPKVEQKQPKDWCGEFDSKQWVDSSDGFKEVEK